VSLENPRQRAVTHPLRRQRPFDLDPLQPPRRSACVWKSTSQLSRLWVCFLTDALQHDGIVVIFDTETNGVARKLRGHTRQVQSLSWSTNDRYLLSAGQDWKCVLWDLKDGSRARTVRFEAAIFIAELHPKNQ